MLLSVVHTTRYSYATEVSRSTQYIRLTPYVCSPWIESTSSRAARIRSFALSAIPAPAPLTAASQTSVTVRSSPVRTIVRVTGRV